MHLISLNAYSDSGQSVTVLQVRKLRPRLMKSYAPGHMAIHGGAEIPGQVSHTWVSAPFSTLVPSGASKAACVL